MNGIETELAVSVRELVLVSRIFHGFTATARSKIFVARVRIDVRDKSGCHAYTPNDVGAARLHTWRYHGDIVKRHDAGCGVHYLNAVTLSTFPTLPRIKDSKRP